MSIDARSGCRARTEDGGGHESDACGGGVEPRCLLLQARPLRGCGRELFERAAGSRRAMPIWRNLAIAQSSATGDRQRSWVPIRRLQASSSSGAPSIRPMPMSSSTWPSVTPRLAGPQTRACCRGRAEAWAARRLPGRRRLGLRGPRGPGGGARGHSGGARCRPACVDLRGQPFSRQAAAGPSLRRHRQGCCREEETVRSLTRKTGGTDGEEEDRTPEPVGAAES